MTAIPPDLRRWVERTAPTYTQEQWTKAETIADWNPQARALLAYRDEVATLPGAFVKTGGGINCDLCCTGDRCDEPRHVDRRTCRMCHGSGSLPEPFAERARELSDDR